jgi:hypothetical protein
MVFRLLLLIGVATLAGCAGIEESGQPREPKPNAACCRSLADATYVALEPGETREFRITEDLQTFGFPEGRSYFVGLALARSDAPRTLTLRILPPNALRPREARIFIPRLAIVAPDGKVSRYVELDFQPGASGLIAQSGGWHGSVKLAAGESRIAVYTATLLPETLRLPMHTAAGGYWYVPSARTGVVEIGLSDS